MRIKITLQAVVEYETDPDEDDPDVTPEGKVADSVNYAKVYPMEFLDAAEMFTTWTVTGKEIHPQESTLTTFMPLTTGM